MHYAHVRLLVYLLLRHIQTIVHTVKILSVSDLLVNNISRAQLSSVVSRVFPT
jgi:hypothetical protein